MGSKIRVLSDHTINKIAAGEVIENPASVVKELVENALDAHATEIAIDIRGGGRQLIRVTDNGCGMNSDDALLCLERHATSKLREIEDIYALDTMGFRGEAIPSIASISKFTLLTRLNGEEGTAQLGTMVIVEGGQILQCCPVECSQGTSIEVKSLFFNIAVRKKFQRSPAYDVAEIQRIVTLQALANPSVKFVLTSNQETLLATPLAAADAFQAALGHRVEAILGKEFFRQQCFVEGSAEGCMLAGYIGIPPYAKHNRSEQFLFINRRAVSSPLVSYAIRDGYGTALASGKHPAFVLHLTMPAELLDVNVHPQKREVRVRQELALKGMITRTVSNALQKHCFYGTAPEASGADAFSTPFALSGDSSFFSNSEGSYALPDFVQSIAAEPPLERYVPQELPVIPPPEPSVAAAPGSSFKASQRAADDAQAHESSRFKLLATIPRYILVEPLLPSQFSPLPLLCIVDQRAAHARIVYEQLVGRPLDRIDIQTLLLPLTFNFVPAEAALLRTHLPTLQEVGIQIREFGTHTFVVDGLPQAFGNVDVERFLTETVENLRAWGNSESFMREREKYIANLAGRAAMSSNQRLQLAEAQGLIDRLNGCRQPLICPHGKPIVAPITADHLKGWFTA
jgi:DNA mismatch repair protein MutL